MRFFDRLLPRDARPLHGQAMLMSILVLGGTLLGATTISGLLMLYQLRQVGDLSNSNKAIYAADTAIEWGNYQIVQVPEDGSTTTRPRNLSNGAISRILCLDQYFSQIECRGYAPTSTESSYVYVIRGFGSSQGANRWFEQSPELPDATPTTPD